MDGKGCTAAPAGQAACPSRDDVSPKDLMIVEPICQPGYEIDSVDGEGMRTQTSGLGGPREDCCYPVTIAVTDSGRGCAVE